eukprot:SAG22_NODE_428_length_10591_cov_8.858178_9_plen_69_part_00
MDGSQALLRPAFERNLAEKAELLATVRNYSACSKASLLEMARKARRVWRPVSSYALSFCYASTALLLV